MMSQLFSFHGHINRSTFWIIYAPIALFSLVVITGIKFIQEDITVTLDSFLHLQDAPLYFLKSPVPLLPKIIIFIIMSILTWIQLATYTKRLHDLDKSGWYSLLVFLPPAVSALLLIYLGFVPGKTGINKCEEKF